MALPELFTDRLTLPLVAAPMTAVSGPDLVIAAARGGVVGAFPTHNARTVDELDHWLRQITHACDGHRSAPVAANLVVHRTNARLSEDIACLSEHGVELVITSVGSPAPVIEPLHAVGCLVFAGVSTMRHVQRAIDAGADGLVLLSAGAGGQTGINNPLSFVRAVRERFEGALVLAGGIADGTALVTAQVLGADLAYMGTKFIATRESLASDNYRRALVDASLDDVCMTTARSGLPANLLTSWLDNTPAPEVRGFSQSLVADLPEVWAAGHSVHGVTDIVTVAELIARTSHEYQQARQALRTFIEQTPLIDTARQGWVGRR